MLLAYFNGKGIAEISRILLAASGEDYEDFRYPLKINDWATYNFTRDEFDKDKADGKLTKSMDKVPFLEVDGIIISQSKSIERYIAHRFNFMGSNQIESAVIDSYCEYLRDFKSDYNVEKKKKNKETLEKWFNETLKEKLQKFDNLLTINETHSQFSIGNKLSLADVSIYSFLVEYFDDKEGVLEALKDCKKLKMIIETVKTNKKIKFWLDNRPVSPF